jgi:type I restriction enzyme S subunit
MEGMDTSTAIPGLSRDDVYACRFPVAPLAEQKRIVAKVEALLERVGKAREWLDRVPGILKKFRQSVLAAACSGRLTADWREMNGAGKTGISILRRLQDEHRKSWELVRTPKKYKPAVRPASELDCELPDTWAIASPEEVCEFIVDCPHSTPKWTDEGEICLRTTNFKPGLLDLTEVRYVSSATYSGRCCLQS